MKKCSFSKDYFNDSSFLIKNIQQYIQTHRNPSFKKGFSNAFCYNSVNNGSEYSLQQNTVFNKKDKSKSKIFKHVENNLLDNIFIFIFELLKLKIKKDYLINIKREIFRKRNLNDIKLFKKSKNTKNYLLKSLCKECRKIIISLNKIKRKYNLNPIKSEILTQPTKYKSHIVKNLSISQNKLTESDEDDTFYGIEDNIDSTFEKDKPSLLSTTFYVTTTQNTQHKKISHEKIIQKCPIFDKNTNEIVLENYQVQPPYISVFDKYFPKIHILYSNRFFSIPFRENFLKELTLNQENNNNSTDNQVNTHKYFRHAQQLLSNNSSQMESIVFGSDGDPSFVSQKPLIKTFDRGAIRESGEDLSFLQYKLKSNLTSFVDEKKVDEGTNLPFDNILEKDMNKSETSMIMSYNEERRNGPSGTSLKEFQERKQRQRIASQANDYRNMSSNFRKIKTEFSKGDNSKPKVMHSPERIKNVQIQNCLEKSGKSDYKSSLTKKDVQHSSDESLSSDNSGNRSINRSDKYEYPSNTSNKKVSFNMDMRKNYNKPEETCKNERSCDKINNLEKEIEGINMMLNNVIRRMNNLELNFQEFSTLFIKLHNETIEVQKNLSVTPNYCSYT